MPEFIFKAAPFLIAAVILLVLARAARLAWLSGESRTWPSVRGKMRVARITGGHDYDEDGRRLEYFDVEVEYEYRVRGQVYLGRQYSFGQERFSTYDGAMKALHGIAAGREVPVYYDPSQPQRAVLRKG
jgi:hypothetical protein